MPKRPELLGPEVDDDPHLVRAAGVLVVRGAPLAGGGFGTESPREFLLLRRPKWYDLPKGHVDPGEDERVAALRELHEEAGLGPDDVRLVDGFDWSVRYTVRERQHQRQPRPKRVMFFLAWCVSEAEVRISREHVGYDWIAWNPPNQIQPFTVDPLLQAAEEWFGRSE